MNGAERENMQPLIQWLTGEDVELSPHLEDKWKKIEVMDDLIRRYPKRKDVIAAFRKKFPEIKSLSTVYRCFHETRYLFGVTHRVNKNYERYVMLDQVNKAIDICFTTDNMKDLARYLEIKAKLLQFDKVDPINPEDLGSHTYILSSDPKVLKLSPPSKNELIKYLNGSGLPESMKENILRQAEEVIPIEETND